MKQYSLWMLAIMATVMLMVLLYQLFSPLFTVLWTLRMVSGIDTFTAFSIVLAWAPVALISFITVGSILAFAKVWSKL